jgi:NitT/TauT family transport system ATP-binding protein
MPQSNSTSNLHSKLQLSGISKVYPKNAGIQQLSLTIPKGQWTSILGPSGCGKSTLLRLIAGIETSTTGSVLGIENQRLGFVFQDAALLPWLTVFENVALPLRILTRKKNSKMSEDQIQSAVKLQLERMGLLGFQKSYPHELSGGMKMRTSLARALVNQPEILLLDEPFAALDEPIRIELGILLQEIWNQMKPTILLVTHSITEAIWLSERILVMTGRPGKIIEDRMMPTGHDRSWEARGSPEFQKELSRYFHLLQADSPPADAVKGVQK